MIDEKIDILVVIRWPVGGIISFLSSLWLNFDPNRYRLTILAPDHPEIQVLLQRLTDYDVEYVPINSRPSFLLFWMEAMRLILKNKFHLVHSQGMTAGVSSVLACIISRTPQLLTLHDMFRDANFKSYGGRIKAVLLTTILSLVDSIHLVSHDARENLLAHLPFTNRLETKLFVSKNGVQIDRFLNSHKLNLRRAYGLADNAYIVGFLGRFMSPKGFVYLVDAIKLLSSRKGVSQIPLVLAFGHDGFLREEVANINKIGLQDYFYFLPFASDVAPILKGIDVLAVPSVWETCPILPMEAMVAGAPIIGTDCVGLREVLFDTPSRVVPSQDSAALADALIEEIRYPSKEKAVKFKKEAARRFNVKIQADAIERQIHNLIRSGP